MVDPAATRYSEADHLTGDVASAEYLLAMKLPASRVEADAEDIAFFDHMLGCTTVDEGLDLVQSVSSDRPIDAKVQFLLAEIVDSLRPVLSTRMIVFMRAAPTGGSGVGACEGWPAVGPGACVGAGSRACRCVLPAGP
ncbi:hypothetical protein [Frankia sp. QA3]|uniref:hypothetical protein n=1 Tax=Frankia sp. QA3 TaxID=710111 RepID=UPI00031EA21B|nr:hypothetical protein [Frankia sp. QA3]